MTSGPKAGSRGKVGGGGEDGERQHNPINPLQKHLSGSSGLRASAE